jgi:hypothetical protein
MWLRTGRPAGNAGSAGPFWLDQPRLGQRSADASHPRRHPMSNPDKSRRVEVKEGDQTIAAAEVTTAAGAEGTARTSLHAPSGHTAPGSRASLVDAVMDLPEVQGSTRLEATVPLGDGEALDRLRERTQDAVIRPAGSTALFDANLRPEAGHGAPAGPGLAGPGDAGPGDAGPGGAAGPGPGD